VPLVSPTVAMGKVIKEKIEHDSKVIFIEPCVAKKAE
jgi:iron only hydrogenase large subunit-like protein